MPGYSGTPLIKKLGIKPGVALYTVGAPREYAAWLGELPDGTRITNRQPAPLTAAHVFATDKAELKKTLAVLRKKLEPDGFVWVSWPKKAAKLEATVEEQTIRELALPLGFVDVKVCAVSEVWSGLKLVIRKSER